MTTTYDGPLTYDAEDYSTDKECRDANAGRCLYYLHQEIEWITTKHHRLLGEPRGNLLRDSLKLGRELVPDWT